MDGEWRRDLCFLAEKVEVKAKPRSGLQDYPHAFGNDLVIPVNNSTGKQKHYKSLQCGTLQTTDSQPF